MNVKARASSPAPILFVHCGDDLYGADLILLQIVTRLDRTKFQPIVVLPCDSMHIGLLSAELKAASIEFVHLPISVLRRRYFTALQIVPFLFNFTRGTFLLCKLIWQCNVRLVHSNTLAVFSGAFAAVITRRPHVWHVHEILLRPRIVRKVTHFLLRHFSDRVICVSGPVRDNILKDEPRAAGSLQVIHNGIELPPPSGSVQSLRKELGLNPGIPVVGMVGRVSAWKGQQVFARAAALVREKGMNAQFVAIGGVFDKDRTHLDQLEQTIHELRLADDFKLVGFRKDARALLRAFDIFVLPSTSPDPLPTVVLEAMSAALPVIATAHGGSLEMVVDGETGVLVSPGDAQSLAEAIASLLLDPGRRVKMGEAGLKRMKEHFEITAFTARITQVYEDLL